MHPEDSFEFVPLPSGPFDAGRFAAGLVAGAAIGVGLALLFAPRTGEETRRDAAETCASLADCASGAVSAVRERLVTTMDDVRERTTEAVCEARSAVEDWLASSKQALENTRQRLDSAVGAGQEAYENRRAELDAQVDAALKG